MRVAIWVLSSFAALWGLAAVNAVHWPLWVVAIPVLVSALLGASAARARFPSDARTAQEGRRVGRLIGVWFVVEIVAMIVVANLLGHWHLERAVTQAIAIIVGLHFVPLARGIPFAGYYGAAAGLIVMGTLGLLLAAPLGLAVTTLGAAVVLWVTAGAVLSRADRRQRG